jgi:hypothetical protein
MHAGKQRYMQTFPQIYIPDPVISHGQQTCVHLSSVSLHFNNNLTFVLCSQQYKIELTGY